MDHDGHLNPEAQHTKEGSYFKSATNRGTPHPSEYSRSGKGVKSWIIMTTAMRKRVKGSRVGRTNECVLRWRNHTGNLHKWMDQEHRQRRRKSESRRYGDPHYARTLRKTEAQNLCMQEMRCAGYHEPEA